MSIQEIFNNITERIQSTASIKAVYGDPITAEGRTIIPVARVCYGFGAGGGGRAFASPSADGEEPQQDLGGGGGGGVGVSPVGIIEITTEETRFISFEERQQTTRAVMLGLLVAFLLLRGRRR